MPPLRAAPQAGREAGLLELAAALLDLDDGAQCSQCLVWCSSDELVALVKRLRPTLQVRGPRLPARRPHADGATLVRRRQRQLSGPQHCAQQHRSAAHRTPRPARPPTHFPPPRQVGYVVADDGPAARAAGRHRLLRRQVAQAEVVALHHALASPHIVQVWCAWLCWCLRRGCCSKTSRPVGATAARCQPPTPLPRVLPRFFACRPRWRRASESTPSPPTPLR